MMRTLPRTPATSTSIPPARTAASATTACTSTTILMARTDTLVPPTYTSTPAPVVIAGPPAAHIAVWSEGLRPLARAGRALAWGVACFGLSLGATASPVFAVAGPPPLDLRPRYVQGAHYAYHVHMTTALRIGVPGQAPRAVTVVFDGTLSYAITRVNPDGSALGTTTSILAQPGTALTTTTVILRFGADGLVVPLQGASPLPAPEETTGVGPYGVLPSIPVAVGSSWMRSCTGLYEVFYGVPFDAAVRIPPYTVTNMLTGYRQDGTHLLGIVHSAAAFDVTVRASQRRAPLTVHDVQRETRESAYDSATHRLYSGMTVQTDHSALHYIDTATGKPTQVVEDTTTRTVIPPTA